MLDQQILCGVIHSALQKNQSPKTAVGYANSLSVIRDLKKKQIKIMSH